MNKSAKTAAVLGATGYTGQELVALLARHPGIELVAATSESQAGRPVIGARLTYRAAVELDFAGIDVVFACLPTGESGVWARKAHEAGALAIDLSADLRASGSGAVYGLPELWRAEVAEADLIANPGCYPTGVLIALAPALVGGLIDHGRPLVIDAASGVTGAGRSARQDLLFGEVAEDFRAYGVGNGHRHVPEMREGMGRLNGGAPQFVFTPHLLPVRRGILETIYLPLRTALSAKDAAALWAEDYRAEPFVLVSANELPSLRGVIGRNVVALGFSDVQDVEAPMLIVVAAFDNLVKGAAGQAIQNANLRLGFAETLGLPA